MELNAASGVPSRSSARRRRTVTLTTVAVTAALVAASATPSAAAAEPVGLLPDSARPQVNAMSVPAPIEVGFTFSPEESGALSAVRFYQNAPNSGVVSASVWSSTGVLLAQAPVDPVAAEP